MRGSICVLSSILFLTACGGAGQARHETTPPATDESPPEPGPAPLPFALERWSSVLPAGAQAVVGADLPALLASETMQIGMKVTQTQAHWDALRQVGERCGISPSRDVHTVVAAAYPGQHMAAVSKGDFDRARVAACLDEMASDHGMAVETAELEGREVFAGTWQGQPFWLLIPRDGVAIVTSAAELMTTILSADTARMETDEGPLRAWLERVPQQQQLWGASQVPPRSELATGFMSMMSHQVSGPPVGMYGAADLSAGLASKVTIVMQADADASAVVSEIRSQLSIIGPAFSLQGVGFVLDGLSLGSKGPLIEIGMTLTAEQVARLAAKIAPDA